MSEKKTCRSWAYFLEVFISWVSLGRDEISYQLSRVFVELLHSGVAKAVEIRILKMILLQHYLEELAL